MHRSVRVRWSRNRSPFSCCSQPSRRAEPFSRRRRPPPRCASAARLRDTTHRPGPCQCRPRTARCGSRSPRPLAFVRAGARLTRRRSKSCPGTVPTFITRNPPDTRPSNRFTSVEKRKDRAMSSRVLVVVHDPQGATQLTTVLARRYDVRATSDAEAAMTALRAWHPALIVTDLEMPIVDGIELCRRVRQISTVPIIVISREVDGLSEVAALDAGADDYVKRPF